MATQEKKHTKLSAIVANYSQRIARPTSRSRVPTGYSIEEVTDALAGILAAQMGIPQSQVLMPAWLKDCAAYVAGIPEWRQGTYEDHLGNSFTYSISKGLVLMGPTGTGKSCAMRALSTLASVLAKGLVREPKSCKVIEKLFKAKGYEYLVGHYGVPGLCLDDMGEELNAKYYANEEDIVGGIITAQYNAWQQKPVLTHATTNLNAQELYERYGERVFYRLYEMCNIIKCTGDNLRVR
jgi:DNA replication protein DnaC